MIYEDWLEAFCKEVRSGMPEDKCTNRCGHPSWAHTDIGSRACRLDANLCPCMSLKLPTGVEGIPFDVQRFVQLEADLKGGKTGSV